MKDAIGSGAIALGPALRRLPASCERQLLQLTVHPLRQVRSTAQPPLSSICARVTISGGAKRTTVWWVSLVSTPCSSSFRIPRARSPAPRSNSTPISRPFPRTSRISGLAHGAQLPHEVVAQSARALGQVLLDQHVDRGRAQPRPPRHCRRTCCRDRPGGTRPSRRGVRGRPTPEAARRPEPCPGSSHRAARPRARSPACGRCARGRSAPRRRSAARCGGGRSPRSARGSPPAAR